MYTSLSFSFHKNGQPPSWWRPQGISNYFSIHKTSANLPQNLLARDADIVDVLGEESQSLSSIILTEVSDDCGHGDSYLIGRRFSVNYAIWN